MKKDDWIRLGITIVIPGIIALGVAYMQSYINFVLFLFLGMIIFFLICIKFLSEPNMPKIKVLDAKIERGNIIGLWVKNVGAGGEVRVSVVNNEGIKARWFKSYREMMDIGGKEKIKFGRGDECYVGITRRAVIGGIRSDIGSHQIKVRFHEANQIFKYGFRITEEGIKDLEVLGEEDE